MFKIMPANKHAIDLEIVGNLQRSQKVNQTKLHGTYVYLSKYLFIWVAGARPKSQGDQVRKTRLHETILGAAARRGIHLIVKSRATPVENSAGSSCL